MFPTNELTMILVQELCKWREDCVTKFPWFCALFGWFYWCQCQRQFCCVWDRI